MRLARISAQLGLLRAAPERGRLNCHADIHPANQSCRRQNQAAYRFRRRGPWVSLPPTSAIQIAVVSTKREAIPERAAFAGPGAKQVFDLAVWPAPRPSRVDGRAPNFFPVATGLKVQVVGEIPLENTVGRVMTSFRLPVSLPQRGRIRRLKSFS